MQIDFLHVGGGGGGRGGGQHMQESLVNVELAEMQRGGHSWHSDQACGLCKDHCYFSLLGMLLCGQLTSVSEDPALLSGEGGGGVAA